MGKVELVFEKQGTICRMELWRDSTSSDKSLFSYLRVSRSLRTVANFWVITFNLSLVSVNSFYSSLTESVEIELFSSVTLFWLCEFPRTSYIYITVSVLTGAVPDLYESFELPEWPAPPSPIGAYNFWCGDNSYCCCCVVELCWSLLWVSSELLA